MDQALRDRLLYRRQYLYGPRVEGFESWQRATLPDACELAVHPDLELTQVAEGENTLVLLGYMLDPNDVQADNRQILVNLLKGSPTSQDLLGKLDRVAGRYVLFVYWATEHFVLIDAAGMRQVFYARDRKGQFWLAAQPGLLEQQLGLEYSPDARAFLESPVIQQSHEPWWPGISTPFETVEHLLPNHLLNLESGLVARYWPVKPITRYNVQVGAEKAAAILRGIMLAANHRFELAMALTGGYDSRIVFAAGREIVHDLHVFSMVYHKLTLKASDITLSDELASYAGVPHQVFHCDQPMDEDFSWLYTHNLEKSYQSYGNIVYGRYLNLDEKKVVIKSVVNEIARCFYYRTGVYPYNVTPDLLCRVSKLGVHPFTLQYFSQWMEDAACVEKLGYKLLDFFYWENRNANWQAMSQLEFDLAHEEFTPFNHRELLSTMLGVDYRQRCMPRNEFQRELVRCSWPELEQFPYNPNARVIKKPVYDGPWMNAARWIKYHLLTKRYKK